MTLYSEILREEGSADPFVDDLRRQNEFLKRENGRLSSYYLDTLQSSQPEADPMVVQDQKIEIERLNQQLREKDFAIQDLEGVNRKLNSNFKSSKSKYRRAKRENSEILKQMHGLQDQIDIIMARNPHLRRPEYAQPMTENIVQQLTPAGISRNFSHTDNSMSSKPLSAIQPSSVDIMSRSREEFTVVPLKRDLALRST